MQALDERRDLVARTERITAANLSEQLTQPQPPIILDVRTPKEWEAEQIVGSLNIPLNRLQDQMDELPEGRPVVVHCESGYRSTIAASILEKHRQEDVADRGRRARGVATREARNHGVTLNLLLRRERR